jgi:hypothetical protein
MSELQKSFAKAKLAGFPAHPPIPFTEADEHEETDGPAELPVDDDDSSASSASSASSTGTIIPSSDQKLFARPQGFVEAPPLLSSKLIYLSLVLPIEEHSNEYPGLPTSSANSSSRTPHLIPQLSVMRTLHHQLVMDHYLLPTMEQALLVYPLQSSHLR